MVCVAEITCFGSSIIESFGGIVIDVAIDTPLNDIEKVAAVDTVLVTITELTRVVVADGVVYKVVLDVAADPRYKTLNVFAIL